MRLLRIAHIWCLAIGEHKQTKEAKQDNVHLACYTPCRQF